MRRKTKMFATMPTAALLMMGMAATSFAAPTNAPGSTSTTNSTSATVKNGWVSEVSGRDTIWYYYSNGVRYRNQWVKSNDLWYFMDSDGVMLTGWQTINGTDYFFDASGAMATGWRKVAANDDRDSYYSGPMANSSSSGSNWYYFATSAKESGYAEGTMVLGWLQLGDKWYYLADDDVESENVEFEYGQMVYGEVEIDGNQYYFGKENEGVMRTGFVKASDINGSSSSSVRPGGSSSSNKEGTYYFGTGGSSIGVKWTDAWLNLNNDWYYFDEEGKMVTGQMATDSRGRWCDYDSADADYYYYLDPSTGKMQTGWVNVKESAVTTNSPLGSSSSGKYYQYYDASGAMRFGWLNSSGKWYYLTRPEDVGTNTFEGFVVGQMATGYIEIDDEGFYLNNSGIMETSTWKELNGESYYFGSNGAMVKSKNTDNLEVIRKSGRDYPIDTDGSPLDVDTTVYYNGSRYSLSQPSTVKKTYIVHSKGYLVESK